MAAATPWVNVAVAVVRRRDGCVLLSQRKARSHQGGRWEFPGGKVERGEQTFAALCRELNEELGIVVDNALPLIEIEHSYPDLNVRLKVMEVDGWTGEPFGRENQPVEWVRLSQLSNYDFPAANYPIIAALGLPPWLANIRLRQTPLELAAATVESVLSRGCGLIRAVCSVDTPAALVQALTKLCRANGARLGVAGEPALELMSYADGVHLSLSQCQQLLSRPIGRRKYFSLEVNTCGELKQANSLGVDFIELVPQSFGEAPESTHRARRRLQNFSRQSTVPVFVGAHRYPFDVALMRRLGVHGVTIDCQALSPLSGPLPSVNVVDALRRARFRQPDRA